MKRNWIVFLTVGIFCSTAAQSLELGETKWSGAEKKDSGKWNSRLPFYKKRFDCLSDGGAGRGTLIFRMAEAGPGSFEGGFHSDPDRLSHTDRNLSGWKILFSYLDGIQKTALSLRSAGQSRRMAACNRSVFQKTGQNEPLYQWRESRLQDCPGISAGTQEPLRSRTVPRRKTRLCRHAGKSYDLPECPFSGKNPLIGRGRTDRLNSMEIFLLPPGILFIYRRPVNL